MGCRGDAGGDVRGDFGGVEERGRGDEGAVQRAGRGAKTGGARDRERGDPRGGEGGDEADAGESNAEGRRG